MAPRRKPRTSPLRRINSGTPLYVQLIMHFRQQIETGKWPVGDTIPSFEELADELDVGRATIRQAIGFLQREGLLASYRGRGTVVTDTPGTDLWLDLPHRWDGLVASADTIEGEVLELDAPVRLPETPDPSYGALAPNYTVLRRLLSRDGIPYLVGISYIDHRIVAEVGENAFREMSIYRAMEKSRRSRATQGEQILTLGAADAETAYLLQIPLNAPVVNVVRWVLDQRDVVIYQSEGRFRSDFVQAYRRLK